MSSPCSCFKADFSGSDRTALYSQFRSELTHGEQLGRLASHLEIERQCYYDDCRAKGSHTFTLRRLQASQAALMTDLFGTRTGACDVGAVGADVETTGTSTGQGRSGRKEPPAELPAIWYDDRLRQVLE